MAEDGPVPIGQLARRTGVAKSALRSIGDQDAVGAQANRAG
jgi:hypothetical protein